MLYKSTATHRVVPTSVTDLMLNTYYKDPLPRNEQRIAAIFASIEIWDVCLNTMPSLVVELGLFLYFDRNPYGLSGITLFFLATIFGGFFAGHSLAVHFRLIYRHRTLLNWILTESFFVMDVFAQAFALSVCGYTLGKTIDNAGNADVGLVVGIVAVISAYFVLINGILMVIRRVRWLSSHFEPHSNLHASMQRVELPSYLQLSRHISRYIWC